MGSVRSGDREIEGAGRSGDREIVKSGRPHDLTTSRPHAIPNDLTTSRPHVSPIAIIDYGVGNLRSVQKAFAATGHEAAVTSDPAVIAQAERVVLPGVGAFGAAAQTLRDVGLEDVTLEAARSGKPFLGICVGMQLLFDVSEEMGEHRGLGLLPGRVVRFPDDAGVKVPQIGWNALSFPKTSPLFDGIAEGAMVYFVHSFYCRPEQESAVAARTTFIAPYSSAVAHGNLLGVQFHPEKSGAVGLQILDNFARRRFDA